MCHMTKYCNVIGPHYKVWRDTACVHGSPYLAEVGVACVHVQCSCAYVQDCVDL